MHELVAREVDWTRDVDLETVRRLLAANPFGSSYFVLETGCNDLDIGQRKVFVENARELEQMRPENIIMFQVRDLEVGESIVDKGNVSVHLLCFEKDEALTWNLGKE